MRGTLYDMGGWTGQIWSSLAISRVVLRFTLSPTERRLRSRLSHMSVSIAYLGHWGNTYSGSLSLQRQGGIGQRASRQAVAG